MRGALITLLLIVATAMQPLLAVPAACTMGGERQKMTCASCCAVQACCAMADQQQSTPLAAVHSSAAELVASVPLKPIDIPTPVERPEQFRSYAQLDRRPHAPPPLALNCIQLI